MADAVYQALDRMVPAIEDLQIRGIFNKDEIKAIVQKRRDFEFLLRRRTARKADCLRYIEYEMNLEELRRLRKERMGLVKSTISDHSGKQLIHFIFERALRKFRGDLELWLQYLDYCAKTKSNRHHSRALAAALQVFPRQAGLWIRAASYEFFDNSNPTSARVLLQRGLRINRTSSKLLWLQYFRLELLYVEKLRGRREALGITGDEAEGGGKKREGRGSEEEEDEEEEGEEGVDLPRLDEEEEEEGDEGGIISNPSLSGKKKGKEGGRDARDLSVAAFFRGAVPRVVFDSAIKAIPGDVSFCMDFFDIAREFPLTTCGEGGLVEGMLKFVEERFGREVEVWARAVHELRREREDEEGEGRKRKRGCEKEKKAAGKSKKKRRKGGKEEEEEEEEGVLPTRRWLEEEEGDVAPGVVSCLHVLEGGVDKCPQSAKMWDYYLRGVTELLDGVVPDGVVRRCLKAGYDRGLLLNAPRWYGLWADLVESGEEAKEVLEKGLSTITTTTSTKEAAAVISQAVVDDDDDVNEARGGSSSAHHLWKRLLAVKVALGGEEVRGLDKVLDKALEGVPREESDDLWLEYVQGGDKGAWERAVVSTAGQARVRVCEAWWEKEGSQAFDKMMKLMSSKSASSSLGLGDVCVRAIEKERGEGGGAARIRAMYESALSVCPTHIPLWEGYEQVERKAGEHKKANAIRWRRERQASSSS